MARVLVTQTIVHAYTDEELDDIREGYGEYRINLGALTGNFNQWTFYRPRQEKDVELPLAEFIEQYRHNEVEAQEASIYSFEPLEGPEQFFTLPADDSDDDPEALCLDIYAQARPDIDDDKRNIICSTLLSLDKDFESEYYDWMDSDEYECFYDILADNGGEIVTDFDEDDYATDTLMGFRQIPFILDLDDSFFREDGSPDALKIMKNQDWDPDYETHAAEEVAAYAVRSLDPREEEEEE